MKFMYFIHTVEPPSIATILLIALGLLIIASILSAYFILKSKSKTIDTSYLQQIKTAFGPSNIEKVTLEKQRVQVIVKDTKKIDAKFFTSENLPAFITGNKITVLFKENAKEIYQFLISKGA